MTTTINIRLSKNKDENWRGSVRVSTVSERTKFTLTSGNFKINTLTVGLHSVGMLINKNMLPHLSDLVKKGA